MHTALPLTFWEQGGSAPGEVPFDRSEKPDLPEQKLSVGPKLFPWRQEMPVRWIS